MLGSLTLAACDAAQSVGPTPDMGTPRPGATPSATSSTGFPSEDAKPDPNFDTGYTVQITDSGFLPGWLVAPCCEAVTWKNLSHAPVTVVFDAVVGGSGQPIQPGAIYVFVPQNIESIAFHSGEHPSMKGVVQVNQLPA